MSRGMSSGMSRRGNVQWNAQEGKYPVNVREGKYLGESPRWVISRGMSERGNIQRNVPEGKCPGECPRGEISRGMSRRGNIQGNIREGNVLGNVRQGKCPGECPRGEISRECLRGEYPGECPRGEISRGMSNGMSREMSTGMSERANVQRNVREAYVPVAQVIRFDFRSSLSNIPAEYHKITISSTSVQSSKSVHDLGFVSDSELQTKHPCEQGGQHSANTIYVRLVPTSELCDLECYATSLVSLLH